MLPIETSNARENVAPTAIPRMLRMASFITLTPRMGTPSNAAIKQANIGPKSQGNGSCNSLKARTPRPAHKKA
jgi:hypothetical protein